MSVSENGVSPPPIAHSIWAVTVPNKDSEEDVKAQYWKNYFETKKKEWFL